VRSGETHYLIKWSGCDESANSWVAESALADTSTLELVAAFEEAQEADAQEEEQEEEEEGNAPEEEEAEKESSDDHTLEGEFVIEALLARRLRRRDQTYEYLVHWGGFGPEEDSWEPADALPADMREEFDAAQRGSARARRA
jgi:hypothetical protein